MHLILMETNYCKIIYSVLFSMFTYVVMFKGVKSNALVTNISCTCELNVHCMYIDFRNLRRNMEEICFAYEINQCTL